MGLSPKTTYKVVWYCKRTTFNAFGRPEFACDFAVVRTFQAALEKLLEWGLPDETPASSLYREKHCGTAKTKSGLYWRNPLNKHTCMSATPYRVE